MNRFSVPVWGLILLMLGLALPAQAQVEELDRVYLVRLDPQKPGDIARCYTDLFDKGKVELIYAFEDSINYLSDIIYEEEAIYGPECFVPDLKLVFRQYTYVLSTYCSKVIKYKNASPYVPSSTRIKNDLVFTPSVLEFIKRLKKKHFGQVGHNEVLISQVITGEPLEEYKEDDLDLDLLLNEDQLDEDEDLELEGEKPAANRPRKKKRVLPEEKDPDDPDGGNWE